MQPVDTLRPQINNLNEGNHTCLEQLTHSRYKFPSLTLVGVFVPVPEDPLVVLGSGAEEGVSGLAGDTVIWGATVACAGICTTKEE